ncbi:NUDIX hydrolase [Nocardioides aquiterrae]|uniref:Nudix hydrolase domain-containing protein n=1 Tax=Nocardioides aquiterrae TaxID=203799 RepID=A0ABP4FF05_9ACTN
MRKIERVEERVAYRNEFVTVFDDKVLFPSGRSGTYLRIEASGGHPGVVLVPIHNDRLGLVFNFRYPIARFQWAFARGFSIDGDVETSAHTELFEELGATASSFELLGHVTPDSGLQSSRVAVLLAHVAVVSAPTDRDEVAATQWVTLDEMLTLVDEGEIEDAFTLSALMIYLRRRGQVAS